MEMEGATIEIDGVTAEIYAEEMGVEYGDDTNDEYSETGTPGPVTIYRLVKREDAEAMGISMEEGSVSTPNSKTKVITRQIINLKNKPKNMILAQKNVHRPQRNDEDYEDDDMMTMLFDDGCSRGSSYATTDRQFFCRLCLKTFRHASHLKRHVNTHTGERAYKCDVCHKEFLDASTLSRHRRTHTGDKPYACKACGKSFGTLGSLRRHMTIHDQDSRPYRCDVCLKRFPDRSSFHKHTLIHTGIKSHVCEVCTKAFVHVGDLNGHRKIHDDVKPYQCSECQRAFAKQSNFARHSLIHYGGKQFECHICNVGYNYQSSLTRHLLTHVKRSPNSNPASHKSKSKVVILGKSPGDDGGAPGADEAKLNLRQIRTLVRQKKLAYQEDRAAAATEEEWLEFETAHEGEGDEEAVELVYRGGTGEVTANEGYEVIEIREVFVGDDGENFVVPNEDGTIRLEELQQVRLGDDVAGQEN